MGRKKIAISKIENLPSRKITYMNRKKGIVKKASQLSILCDTDVALILFSPSGDLTAFASNERIEDVLLRFVDMPNDVRGGSLNNKEFLSVKLKQIKREREMLEKIALIEDLEKSWINSKLDNAIEWRKKIMRFYKANVEKIDSIPEASRCSSATSLK